MRTEASISSVKLQQLTGGAPIKMVASFKDGWDNERIRICEPVEGWVSKKCVVFNEDVTE